MQLTRRRFLMRSSLQTAGLAAAPALMSACVTRDAQKKGGDMFKNNGIVLFQGDSITDAGRDKAAGKANDVASLGRGYALFTAADLLASLPERRLTIYNRGISGNKVYQLDERWQEDCLALKPDILSILIGVNDYWHKRSGNYDGTVEIYERDFRALLRRTINELPAVTLVICEPFAIDGGTAIGDGWQEEFAPYRKVARNIATDFKAIFVPFHALFQEAVKTVPADYWGADGVHPSMAGANLMARAWMKAVNL